MILFSILTPLEDLLRHLLNGLHSLGLPWAWSIVGLTVVIRLLLVPLAVKQIHSLQKMQAHAPQMKELQRKHKDNRQKLNEELMKYYQEHKINPATSCLPLLVQIPIFIGLFYTLRAFAKHPPPGDLSWLHFVPSVAATASSHWSGWLLIAVYVLSQLAAMYFAATTMQRSQRLLLMFLPFVFIPFIIHFPTGLVLYWMTTNLWTIGQGMITRRLMPRTALPLGAQLFGKKDDASTVATAPPNPSKKSRQGKRKRRS